MSNVENKERSTIESLIVDENEEMSQDTVEQIVEKNSNKQVENSDIPMAKAEELLKQINSYLNDDKNK